MNAKVSTYNILGIPIAATTLNSTAAALRCWSKDQTGRYVGVRDVASLMALRSDADLLRHCQSAALNLPDGMPLVWIGRLRGHAVSRGCGPDLMEKLLMASGREGLKHFFYGGKPGVAKKLARVFRNRNPQVDIVGTHSPPFRCQTRQEDDAVTASIRASGADIVWVGLSSPKQDIWMHSHVDLLPQTLIGVGAAFDFHAGEKLRAPKWMQGAGLEWLFRLMTEPRRLWRRYLILAPLFLWDVFWEDPTLK